MSATVDIAEPKPRAKKKPSFFDLFDAADQDRIRADLSTFFGPNADAFLQTYEKMRAAPSKKRAAQRAWCWPAFFGSFTWFFYRKMYAYGAMIIFLPVVFAYLFGTASGATWILFAMWAKTWYVNYGLGRIFKADKLELSGAERTDYLRRAGGVSLPAGIFAGVIYASMLALVILAFIVRGKTGH
jgi:hypothetical protein